jgi:hypothetical protein
MTEAATTLTRADLQAKFDVARMVGCGPYIFWPVYGMSISAHHGRHFRVIVDGVSV